MNTWTNINVIRSTCNDRNHLCENYMWNLCFLVCHTLIYPTIKRQDLSPVFSKTSGGGGRIGKHWAACSEQLLFKWIKTQCSSLNTSIYPLQPLNFFLCGRMRGADVIWPLNRVALSNTADTVLLLLIKYLKDSSLFCTLFHTSPG